MTDWVRRAKGLAWLTILYNLLEGIVSVLFGVSDDSMSLFGFGLDSFIEVFSATLVLWRFSKESSGHQISIQREKTATRAIGVLFVLLAMTTLAFSALQLIQKRHPETTVPGLVISVLSLGFMFFLWFAKRTAGQALSSPTVLGDASCSFACIKLSIVLLLGSLLYWRFPQIWWADGVAAVGLAGLIFREGYEMIRGEGCCCGSDCRSGC